MTALWREVDIPVSPSQTVSVSLYLSDSLRSTSEIVALRCLRSADTTTLQMPSTRRATLGHRAFPVAAARAWNSLLGLAPPLWHFGGRPSLTFSISCIRLPWRCSFRLSANCSLCWAVQQYARNSTTSST